MATAPVPWSVPPVPLAAAVRPNSVATSTTVCDRSEEHTSELQSPCNLVCRLLLEKKKCAAFKIPSYNDPGPATYAGAGASALTPATSNTRSPLQDSYLIPQPASTSSTSPLQSIVL